MTLVAPQSVGKKKNFSIALESAKFSLLFLIIKIKMGEFGDDGRVISSGGVSLVKISSEKNPKL